MTLAKKLSIFQSPYNSWTPEQILAYYRARTGVHYFPVLDPEQTTPEKTEGILTNCFEFNHERYQLPAHFDWTINPSRDKEWLILLHKFYYAVGLGAAYQSTKAVCYVEKWLELTSSWIDSVPLDFLSSDVTGRRLQNWIFAHYYFVTPKPVPQMSPEFYLRFLTSLHRQLCHLRQNLTPARNHRTIELYALFLTAVVFPELEGAAEWLDFSRQELLKNMQADLLADGVQCELSTDYHHLVLKNYLNIRRLALLNQIPMPAEMDTLLKRALDFAMYVHKPDGWIPSLSDGDSRSFLDLLAQGYQLYGDEAMLYVATQGQQGHPPACRSKVFPASGYSILRSGWGSDRNIFTDEQYLIFDCGPLGAGNHGHFDLLSFELAAYGQTLIVDPGRYTYDESGETNWRALFRGTAAHNTVLVDNQNQTRYVFHKTRFKVKGPEPKQELKTFMSCAAFDFLHGAAHSFEYDVVHERQILFVWPEYWLISDILLAPEVHHYDLRFHLSDQAKKNTELMVERDTLLVHAPHLVLAQAFNTDIKPEVEEGFISRTYGVKQPAPVVSLARHAANAAYHTILYPYKVERPEIAVAEIPVTWGKQVCSPTEAFALCITIAANGRRFKDYYFKADPTLSREYAFADFSYNGSLLLLRQDAAGNMLNLQTQPGANLTLAQHRIRLFQENNSPVFVMGDT